jgi:hypothetical protein
MLDDKMKERGEIQRERCPRWPAWVLGMAKFDHGTTWCRYAVHRLMQGGYQSNNDQREKGV